MKNDKQPKHRRQRHKRTQDGQRDHHGVGTV
jgi:hypothetical protein